MMKKNAERGARFRDFVSLRRRWFACVFVVAFAAMLVVSGRRFHSAVEILGVSAVGALVLTTVVSLLSAPVIWFLSGRRKKET